MAHPSAPPRKYFDIVELHFFLHTICVLQSLNKPIIFFDRLNKPILMFSKEGVFTNDHTIESIIIDFMCIIGRYVTSNVGCQLSI